MSSRKNRIRWHNFEQSWRSQLTDNDYKSDESISARLPPLSVSRKFSNKLDVSRLLTTRDEMARSDWKTRLSPQACTEPGLLMKVEHRWTCTEEFTRFSYLSMGLQHNRTARKETSHIWIVTWRKFTLHKECMSITRNSRLMKHNKFGGHEAHLQND